MARTADPAQRPQRSHARHRDDRLGKSRFLAGLILNLLERGQPLTLIDPHGDLVRLVLAQIVARGYFNDEAAYERLAYLDLPAAERRGRYLPFNILNQAPPPHSLAAQIKEAFHRAWPALGEGAAPMFDTLLQNAVKMLISNDEPLTRLHQLLSDHDYRQGLLRQEQDPEVASFFSHQFDRLPLRDQLNQAGSTLRRAHLLSFAPALRYSLGQPEQLLDFRRLIDAGRSQIINLALPDADARRLFGCLLTVSAEQAALSRSELPPVERQPSHLLITDEWSEFAAQSGEALARMLDLTRKVGLFAVLAHQTWSQTSERLRGALQNVGLEVAFRMGRQDAEYTARRFGQVDGGAIKHTIADPRAAERGHPLFEPLLNQWEGWIQALQRLPDRRLFLLRQDGRLQCLDALPVPEPQGIDRQLAQVEEIYLQRYFRPPYAALGPTIGGEGGKRGRLHRRRQLE